MNRHKKSSPKSPLETIVKEGKESLGGVEGEQSRSIGRGIKSLQTQRGAREENLRLKTLKGGAVAGLIVIITLGACYFRSKNVSQYWEGLQLDFEYCNGLMESAPDDENYSSFIKEEIIAPETKLYCGEVFEKYSS